MQSINQGRKEASWQEIRCRFATTSDLAKLWKSLLTAHSSFLIESITERAWRKWPVLHTKTHINNVTTLPKFNYSTTSLTDCPENKTTRFVMTTYTQTSHLVLLYFNSVINLSDRPPVLLRPHIHRQVFKFNYVLSNKTTPLLRPLFFQTQRWSYCQLSIHQPKNSKLLFIHS